MNGYQSNTNPMNYAVIKCHNIYDTNFPAIRRDVTANTLTHHFANHPDAGFVDKTLITEPGKTHKLGTNNSTPPSMISLRGSNVNVKLHGE